MAKDIEIQIGAQDTASKILDKVGDKTSYLARRTERLADRSEDASGRITIGFKNLFAAAAGFAVFDRVAAGIEKAIGAAFDAITVYEEYQRATINLTEAQKELARALQNDTLIDDAEIAKAIELAETIGIADNEIERLIRSAAALARANDDDLIPTLRDLKSFLDGDVAAFDELLVQMKSVESDGERLAIINDAINRGLQLQAKDLESGAAASRKLALAYGDLQVKIGNAFAPGKQLAAEFFSSVVNGLERSLPSLSFFTSELSKNMIVMDSMETLAKRWGAAIEISIANIGDSLSLLATDVELFAAKTTADIEHTLTVAIPAYAEWFAINFPAIISDGLIAAGQSILEFGKSVPDLLAPIYDAINSGSGKVVEDLGDRFIETMQKTLDAANIAIDSPELPDIPEREKTTWEIELEDEQMQTSLRMLGRTADILADRFSSMELGIDEPNQLDLSDLFRSIEEAGKSAIDNVGNRAQDAADGLKKMIPEFTGQNAVESRLLTRGPDQDPFARLTKLSEQSDAKLASIDKSLQEMSRASQLGLDNPGLEVVMVS